MKFNRNNLTSKYSTVCEMKMYLHLVQRLSSL